MRTLLSALLIALLATTPALADDWVAAKLRGSVYVNDLRGDGKWQPLRRGEVVSDDRVIRTMASGNVEFTRDAEVISLGPNTQVQIVDRKGKRYTTVKEQYGKVAIEANVENVQHFAVETPYLVAVVKGTKFTVTTSDSGSQVKVTRGLVAVTGAGRQTVLVPAGQQVSGSASGRMQLSGKPNQAQAHPVINGVVEDALPRVLGHTVAAVGTVTNGVVNTATTAVGSTVTTATTAVGTVATGVTGVVTGTVTTTTSAVGGLLGGLGL
jgi:hypothetical protein